MYLETLTVTLLCGISLVSGFFHFKHKDFLLKYEESFNKSILRSDPTHWIEQLVNHFNYTDHRTWRQKYYKVIDSWKPEGPILLSLGGEVGITREEVEAVFHLGGNDDESTSLIRQITEETSAAFFMLEHRYYGDSQPFHEPTTENMAFLHSRQALADAAHLLKTIKKSRRFRKSKVIVVGGSYSGNLAAWMKLMYPELVDAVLASSAPLLAKRDFYEYLEGVTDTFRTYGSQECVDKITERFNKFRELFQTPEGIKRVKVENFVCEDVDMTVSEHQQSFYQEMVETYSYEAQYGTPASISSMCRDFDHNLFTPYRTSESNVYWNGEKNCSHYVIPPNGDWRSWSYQTCTEFGYFQSTSSCKQMFGNFIPVDYFYKGCRNFFGEEFDEKRVDQGVINTNRMYGGLTPNVTNVVFVNGDMDPWHRLSIVQDLSADAPAIFINGSSHCYDQAPDINDPKDNENIKEARKQIKNLLKKWIGQA